MATSTEIAERRQRIVETIAAWGGRGPTISELQDYLSRDLSLSTRHVEREIRTLAGMGLVGKDGDRWRVLDLDDFDRLSSEYAACLVTKIAATTLDFALPADLQLQIRRFVARSDARLNKAFVNHPARRWQQALKIIPASSHLEIPLVNADVRDAIEQAILERRQVILKYSSEVTYRASISHLLLRLPNSATILTWEPGADDAVPIEYQLVELESVEVLEEAASWPMDFNIDAYIDGFGKRSPRSAYNPPIELLVDPVLVHHWNRRRVKKSITAGDLDACSGRIRVTIDEELNSDLAEWLWGYAALLEVRSPADLREQFAGRARSAARVYADDPDQTCAALDEDQSPIGNR